MLKQHEQEWFDSIQEFLIYWQHPPLNKQ
jgi:hypothetical protein